MEHMRVACEIERQMTRTIPGVRSSNHPSTEQAHNGNSSSRESWHWSPPCFFQRTDRPYLWLVLAAGANPPVIPAPRILLAG